MSRSMEGASSPLDSGWRAFSKLLKVSEKWSSYVAGKRFRVDPCWWVIEWPPYCEASSDLFHCQFGRDEPMHFPPSHPKKVSLSKFETVSSGSIIESGPPPARYDDMVMVSKPSMMAARRRRASGS